MSSHSLPSGVGAFPEPCKRRAASVKRMGYRLAAVLVGLGAMGLARGASAGEFDASGRYIVDPDATAFVDFGEAFDPDTDRYVPKDAQPECLLPAFEKRADAGALVGDHVVHVEVSVWEGCAERFVVSVPPEKASYRATVWMRGGSVGAQMTAVYPENTGRAVMVAKMAPTGRVTSDGWVELASNDFPVDGETVEAVYVRIIDYDSVGSAIDALELVPSGSYWEQQSCSGARDSVCGPEAVCVHQKCRLTRLYVPPLPDQTGRDAFIDTLSGQLKTFFGGRKTRLQDLPVALDTLEATRASSSPWAFWNGVATAIRRLHDWHTSISSSIQGVPRQRRLNVCFIEGQGDTTAATWPAHAVYKDVLVSHVGKAGGNQGIQQGDRLTTIDGVHPIAWALSLHDVNWSHWQADDSSVHSEFAERMRGLILAYAKTFTIIHCDAQKQTCDDKPTTYAVSELPEDTGGQVGCDNRPFYHFKKDNPGANHHVGWDFFSGPIANTTDEEAIYGLLWDTLYGGGDPNGHVNGNLTAAFTTFRNKARGVILDHRAGSGGTMDAAEKVTTLVRPPAVPLVFASPMEIANFDGPANSTEGKALYFLHVQGDAMNVGAADFEKDLPVALLLHRDGSASDFMPFGMKGADKVRLFGPAPTAGAFSTYYNFQFWSLSWQIASGDSISQAGEGLIGHGVVPDQIVLQTQSDLLAGKDTIHEAALAWLRTGLKP